MLSNSHVAPLELDPVYLNAINIVSPKNCVKSMFPELWNPQSPVLGSQDTSVDKSTQILLFGFPVPVKLVDTNSFN